MKSLKLITLTIVSLVLYLTSAYAACDFIINIGDKQTKLAEKFIEPLPMFPGQFMLPISSSEVCPNDNLTDDIAVEYIFLKNNISEIRLAAIRMVVLNDGTNTVNNQLTLMNYAKKVYGKFDTGQNPKIYNNFHVFKNNIDVVIYKRLLNEESIIEEEIFITNKTYDEKLGQFYFNLEQAEFELDQGTN